MNLAIERHQWFNPLHLALLALVMLLTLAPACSTHAQETKTPASSNEDERLRDRNRELEAARDAQRKASEREKNLKSEIESIGKDRAQLNRQLIDAAARVSKIETDISATEARLKPLDERERILRGALVQRQAETTEVLAALQRAGRRLPPALMVRPEDALQSLRTAMLLGAVVPEMRARAEVLVSDLGDLVNLRKNIAQERDRLATDREKLAADQQKVTLLIEARQKQQSETEREMQSERTRAAELAKQVDNLKDLIAKLENDLKSAAKAAEAASLKGVPVNPAQPTPGALSKDSGRLAPAIAFASAKGLLPLPVAGLKIHEFGGSDGAGGTQKGLSIATRLGAQVNTPADGWVVYAGPFRSYGQLLILNAGGGYHVLLAGMDRITVNIGQFVVAGEPVALMGTGSRVAAILATNPGSGSGQPVLYIEFRKDGAPIDPGPWWASGKSEKVRG
jgi:septal ring factor EnvC (AmiA/AmiB activator)